MKARSNNLPAKNLPARSFLARNLLIGVALALAAVATPAHGDGARFWQEGDVAMVQQEKWNGGFGWKLASEPSSARLHAWEVKPRLQWRWRPGLDSAVTYKFVRGRSGEHWNTTQALEFDLTPSWTIGEHFKAHLTHRLGIVYPASGELAHRYHTILRIDWPGLGLPAQMTAESSLEGVYDLSAGRWHESKLSPLRVKFYSGRSTAWFISYVLNHRRVSRSDWAREHVLQLAVAFNFATRTE